MINNYQLMKTIMQGKYETNQLIELLKKFQKNEPSPETLNSFLKAIQDSAEYTINTQNFDKPIVDLAGTGGDEKNMINLSTLSALTCAATGLVNVAKYGNRSATSLCGSMDVLEKIGSNIDLTKKQIKQQLKDTHFAPLYARAVYPGGKFVGPARAAVQGATIFNILFPLARPIHGDLSFVFGLAKETLFPQIENIYLTQKNIRCILVHGLDSTDEISISGKGQTKYSLIENGQIVKGLLDCQKIFNIRPVNLTLLQIAHKEDALDLFLQTLNPDLTNKKLEAIRNAVIANASVALFIALDKNNKNVKEAAKYTLIVKDALTSGKALALLKQLQKTNQKTPAFSPHIISPVKGRKHEVQEGVEGSIT
jgi:anthranilate phosphoribosyltransferase